MKRAVLAICLLAGPSYGACEVTKAELQTLNTAINAYPKRAYTGDHWKGLRDFELRGGNCASFAAAKMTVLLTTRCDVSDMRFVDGVSSDQGHRILEVKTKEGVFYMDNRFDRVTVEPKDFQ